MIDPHFDSRDNRSVQLPRRTVLGLASSTFFGGVSGCIGTDSGEDGSVRDSDGDGVVDGEDYAPQDPAVSSKSDLEGATPSGRATATPTETPTRTPTPTATPEVSADEQIRLVDGSAFEGVSYISTYTPTSVGVEIHPDDPNLSRTTDVDLVVAAAEFPREAVLAEAATPVDAHDSEYQSYTVDLDLKSVDPDGAVHLLAFLVPRGASLDTVDAEDVQYFHESDPFVLTKGGRAFDESFVPELSAVGDDSGESHARTDVEGSYSIEVSGRTMGRSWAVSYYVYKSAYVDAVRRDHGRSIPQFVSYEMLRGFAAEFAVLLEEEAVANGFTDKREQVEFVIDFVQQLPYVPDDVSTGYDDYTKYALETLTETGGDCEDTAILIAAVLQSDPFNYDMVLIELPGHVACGIKGSDDLPGYYWEYDDNRYYYIETTGVGWGIGDLPDEYQDEKAIVHQV